jgi:hypothetical protein
MIDWVRKTAAAKGGRARQIHYRSSSPHSPANTFEVKLAANAIQVGENESLEAIERAENKRTPYRNVNWRCLWAM